MVAEQVDCLGDELTFVIPTRAAILPPQLAEDFRLGLLAHKVVHPLGNTDFWRNDSFSPRFPPGSGNKTFGADRVMCREKCFFIRGGNSYRMGACL